MFYSHFLSLYICIYVQLHARTFFFLCFSLLVVCLLVRVREKCKCLLDKLLEQIILHGIHRYHRMNEAWNILQADASVTIKVKNIKAILLIILRDLMISIHSHIQIHLWMNTHTHTQLKICVNINACAFAWMRFESIKQKASVKKSYSKRNVYNFQPVWMLNFHCRYGKKCENFCTFVHTMYDGSFLFVAAVAVVVLVVVVAHNGNHSILCNIKCITPHEAG